jgi:hypothetical protein
VGISCHVSPASRLGGLLISDDAAWNLAFSEFTREVGAIKGQPGAWRGIPRILRRAASAQLLALRARYGVNRVTLRALLVGTRIG